MEVKDWKRRASKSLTKLLPLSSNLLSQRKHPPIIEYNDTRKRYSNGEDMDKSISCPLTLVPLLQEEESWLKKFFSSKEEKHPSLATLSLTSFIKSCLQSMKKTCFTTHGPSKLFTSQALGLFHQRIEGNFSKRSFITMTTFYSLRFEDKSCVDRVIRFVETNHKMLFEVIMLVNRFKRKTQVIQNVMPLDSLRFGKN